MLLNKGRVLPMLLLVMLTSLLNQAGCSHETAGIDVTVPDPHEILTEHSRRFTKRVEEVTDGVYVAIGYALGNSILIATEAGNIIIDTTESVEAAREIRTEFEQISNMPIVAVIYTHGHPDHILGTSVFLEKAAEEVEILSHAGTIDFLIEQFGLLQQILNARGMRQFGTYLPEEYASVLGLGPLLRFDHEKLPTFIFPTKVFDRELTLEIGGEKLVLLYAPGETEDQIVIWMPEKKVLFAGDNYYPAFPNLYTIRGSSPRPINQWINSLDLMKDLEAEYMVPSHTEPVYGAERINELLTMYRDAIQHIHDAVIRGANEGKNPDQLVAEIKLPPHLAAYPELRELYGKVSWSVRGIYDGYLGWFDGNATNLEPLPYWERAQKIADLAGGSDKLLEEAKQSLDNEEYQWAAELADMLLALDPEDQKAVEIKIEALIKIGQATYNTNARCYYFTSALELAGRMEKAKPLQVGAELAHLIPLDLIFRHMAVKLDPVASADQEITAVFKITDTGEDYTVMVRRGVAEIRFEPVEDADLVINMEKKVWQEIALGVSNPLLALATGKIKVDGNKILLLKKFFSFFKQLED